MRAKGANAEEALGRCLGQEICDFYCGACYGPCGHYFACPHGVHVLNDPEIKHRLKWSRVRPALRMGLRAFETESGLHVLGETRGVQSPSGY